MPTKKKSRSSERKSSSSSGRSKEKQTERLLSKKYVEKLKTKIRQLEDETQYPRYFDGLMDGLKHQAEVLESRWRQDGHCATCGRKSLRTRIRLAFVHLVPYGLRLAIHTARARLKSAFALSLPRKRGE